MCHRLLERTMEVGYAHILEHEPVRPSHYMNGSIVLHSVHSIKLEHGSPNPTANPGDEIKLDISWF